MRKINNIFSPQSVLVVMIMCFVMVVSMQSVSANVWTADLGTDLRHYYNLDETSGGTSYDGLGLIDGINNNLDVNIDGLINKSYNFTSSSSRINFTKTMFSNFSSGTISYWVYTERDGITQELHKQNHDGVGTYLQGSIQADGKIYFQTSNGHPTTSSSTIVKDNWYHLVYTWNASATTLSINGTLENTTAGNTIGSLSGTTYPWQLGSGQADVGGNPNFVGRIDELGIWNRTLTPTEITQLYNEGNGLVYPSINIILNSPVDNLLEFPYTDIIFNITLSSDMNELSNISLYINGTLNETKILTGTSTTETFTKSFPTSGNYNWFIDVYDNESNHRYSDTRNFIINSQKISSESHSISSYETASETFTINLSTYKTLSSVKLVYNGTEYTATQSGTNWSKTIDVPSTTFGNLSYHYKLTYSDATTENTQSYYQNVSAINLTYCTTGTPYINFTFKDESDESIINATIPTSTLIYWLGSGDVKKTLTYINTTAHYSYAFCFTPVTRPLNLDYRMQYQSEDYPQRTSEPNTFTINNATTNKTLYLLGTADGIYVTFQVINTANQLISGVDVSATRTIGSEDVVVAIGTTGASGAVTFWLNPDFEHDFSFSKTGYTTYEYSDTPTQTSYTITLPGTTTSINSSFQGIDYFISPRDTYLINDTEYTFSFKLTSSYWDVSEYGFNLRLSNGTEIDGGSTGTGGTNLTLVYDVNNQTIIYIDYYWIIDGNTTTASTYWIVQNSENTGWSLAFFFTDLNTYLDSGIFGLDEFGRYLITFLIIFLSVGLMSYKFGFTSPMSITTLIFGIVFFLDVVAGIIPTIRGIPYLLTFISALILVLAIFNEVRLR